MILLGDDIKRKIVRQYNVNVCNEELKIMNSNDNITKDKVYYGAINYTFDEYGREYSKILFVVEDKDIMLSKVDDFYNDKLKGSYYATVLYKVRNINPHMVTINILRRLSIDVCQYILLGTNVKKNYVFHKFDDIKINSLGDIIRTKDAYNSKKCEDDNLRSILFDNLDFIKHKTIIHNIQSKLKVKKRPTIRAIFMDSGYKHKWYHTKKYMIKKIINSIDNAEF